MHIRVQQRNGRKCITTVAGLAEDLDVKKILKSFKKNFSCNGAIAKDTELGQVRDILAPKHDGLTGCRSEVAVESLPDSSSSSAHVGRA